MDALVEYGRAYALAVVGFGVAFVGLPALVHWVSKKFRRRR